MTDSPNAAPPLSDEATISRITKERKENLAFREKTFATRIDRAGENMIGYFRKTKEKGRECHVPY